MLLNWYFVCLKMLNPLGADDGYDVDVPEELDNNIWRSSVMIWKQDTQRTEPLIQFEEPAGVSAVTCPSSNAQFSEQGAKIENIA